MYAKKEKENVKVALLTESVDRNGFEIFIVGVNSRRSPHGERG